MATWRKVVVSGSSSRLKSIGVGLATAPATEGNISASGKLFASSSVSTGLGSYNVVIKNPTTGEFMHTGSDAIAPTLQTLNLGTGLTGTSYNGSGAVTTAVDSASLAGNGISALDSSAGAGFKVNLATNGNLSLASSGISVNSGSLISVNHGLTTGTNNIQVAVADGGGIGFDAAQGGALTASFVTGDALSAGNGLSIDTTTYNGSAASAISVVASDLNGTGISVTSNNFEVKGASSLTDGTLIKWNDTDGQFEDSLISEGASSITIGGAGNTVNFNGNLTVAGTASFTHASNLSISDDFVVLNSGSTSDTAFGIVGQIGTSADSGIGWAYRPDSSGLGKRFFMTTGSLVDSGGSEGGPVGAASLLVDSTSTSETDEFKAQEGNFLVSSDEIYVYF